MLSWWLDYCPLGWKTQGWKSCYWLQDGRWPETKNFHFRWPLSFQMLGSCSYSIPLRWYCHSWLPIFLRLWWYFHLATSWWRANPTSLWYWFRNRSSRVRKNPRIRSTITTTSDHHYAIWTMHVPPLGWVIIIKRWPRTFHLNPSKRSRYLRAYQARTSSQGWPTNGMVLWLCHWTTP